MRDESKTKKQLIAELQSLRQCVNQADVSQSGPEMPRMTSPESGSRYPALLEDLPSLICCFRPGCVITYANRAYCRYFGKTAEELVGTSFLSLIPEKDRKPVLANLSSLNVETPSKTIEHQVIATDGEIRWQRWIDRATFDDEGRPVAYLSIGEDITGRKRAEEKLRESELRFRSLIQQTTDAVFCYECNPPIPIDLPIEEQARGLYGCVLVECNDVCAASYGAARAADVVGKNLTDLFGAASGSLDGLFTALIQGGYKIVDRLSTELHEDGSKRYYLNNGYGVVQDGQLLRIWGTFRDITDRKRAEEALQESEHLLRKMAENYPNSYISIIEKDYTVGFTSGQEFKKQNLDPEQFVGLTLEQVFGDQASFIRQNYEKTFKGEECTFELFINNQHQLYRTVPLRSEDGSISRILAVVENITERKQAEAALEETSRIINRSPAVAFLWRNCEGWPTEFVTENVEDLFGFTAEEFRNGFISYDKVIHPDDLRRVGGEVSRYSSEEDRTGFAHQPYRIVTRDGKVKWVDDVTEIRRDECGRVTHFEGIVTDVTGRERAANLTRIQRDLALATCAATNLEEGLRCCLEAAIDASGMDCGGVYLVDDTSGALDMVCHKGLSDDFVDSVSHFETGTPNAQIVRAGQPVYTHYHKLKLNLDGAQRNEGLRIIAVVPVKYDNCVVACLNIASHSLDDVPDHARTAVEAVAAQAGGAIARLKAKEDLRESEERFRFLFQSSTDCVVILDRNHRYLHANQAANAYLGCKDGQTIEGLSISEAMRELPEFRDLWIHRVDKYFETEHPNSAVDSVRVGDRIAWSESSLSPIKDASGNIVAVGIMYRDITDRKRAEQALKDSEEKFRNLAEYSPNMIFINVNGRVVYANPMCSEIMGYTREEFTDPDFDFMCLIAPQSHGPVRTALARHLRGEEVEPYEYSLVTRAGKVFEAIVTPKLINYDGGPALLGVVTDITERKQAEESVKTERDRAQMYLDIVGSMLVVLDRDKKVTMINRAGCELLGYTKDRIEGRDWFANFIPERLRVSMSGVFDELMSGQIEAVEFYENPILTATGQERLIAWHNTVLRNAEGHITGTLSSGEDITESKQAEQALRASEERYRELVENATEGIAVAQDGMTKFVNRKIIEFTQYTEQELLSRPFTDLIHPDDQKMALNYHRKRLAGEPVPQTYDFRIVNKTGSIRWIQIAGVRVSWEGRSASLNFLNDITARKEAEHALRTSEERYRELVENATEGIAVAQDGRLKFVNPRVREYTSYTDEELCSRPFLEFIHPDDQATVRENHLKRFQGGDAPESYAFRIIGKNGKTRWLETKAVMIMWDGKPAVLVFLNDITHRREAEEALRESEEKYRRLFAAVSDAITMFDAETWQFVDVNDAALQLYGYTRDEFLRLSHSELTAEPEESALSIQQTLEGALSRTLLRYHLKKDGTVFPVEISGSVMTLHGRKILCSVVRDISERKRMEEELARADKLESIGVLAGGIAHDFNNILTGVAGNLSLASMDAEPDGEMAELLSGAEKALDRARDLTHQLLTFSRGGAPVKKTASVSEIIQESSRFSLRGSNVRCELDVPENLWSAEVDSGQISQVINNLILNADQAMPDGGVVWVTAGNITIGDKSPLPLKPGKYIRFAIRDQGIGISDEHKKRIFDPFFTTKQRGSGLGLASTYSIVKQHDGHIECESQLGAGSAFRVYLPASDRARPGVEHSLEDITTGTGRLLVMDDDQLVREVADKSLTRLGYEVEFASDGSEAVRIYKQRMDEGKPFDAVILDLTVPGGMGGKEAIWELRRLNPNIKSLVCSGYSNDPALARHREYGFSGVVTKPFRIGELARALKELFHNPAAHNTDCASAGPD